MINDGTQDSENEGQILIMVLAVQLQFLVCDTVPEEFDYAGQRFFALMKNDFIGFYDWLKDPKGDIIGVYFRPFDFSSFSLEALGRNEYVVTTVDGIQLFFGPKRSAPTSHSIIECFGGNRLFRSAEDVWAISFNLLSLSPPEKLALKSLASGQNPHVGSNPRGA